MRGLLVLSLVLWGGLGLCPAGAEQTCSASAGCGVGCQASGNVSASCSATSTGVVCTSVNQEGNTEITTTVVVKCPKTKLT